MGAGKVLRAEAFCVQQGHSERVAQRSARRGAGGRC